MTSCSLVDCTTGSATGFAPCAPACIRQALTRLFFLFHPRRSCGAFAGEEDDRLLVLGAVPVHLFGVVGYECAGVHGDRVAGIKFSTGADPPGSFHHHKKSVVGMIMGTAEIARKPLDQHQVKAGLRWVAE